MSQTTTHLRAIREKRGISSIALARAVGVSRQTIHAIETGTYVPNTTVALLLARNLEVTVEELFSLDLSARSSGEEIPAELLSAADAPVFPGAGVRLGKVGHRTLAIPAPAEPVFLPDTDAVLTGTPEHGRVRALTGGPESCASLVIAGCDPGLSLVPAALAGTGVALASCGSRQALEWLREGRIHIAGTHLKDPSSGEYNVATVRRLFPRGGYKIVTFATWEVGLVVARGNPKGIRSVADLVRTSAKRGVVLVNREQGAGSRELLDSLLSAAGLEPERIRGYTDLANGHLPAAHRVASGSADVCLATRVAARTLGLDFIPLAVERYDLVTLDRHAATEPVRLLFDALNRASLRRRLHDLAGYDTGETGMSR